MKRRNSLWINFKKSYTVKEKKIDDSLRFYRSFVQFILTIGIQFPSSAVVHVPFKWGIQMIARGPKLKTSQFTPTMLVRRVTAVDFEIHVTGHTSFIIPKTETQIATDLILLYLVTAFVLVALLPCKAAGTTSGMLRCRLTFAAYNRSAEDT